MTCKATLAVALLGFACFVSNSQSPTIEKSTASVMRESARSDISPMRTSSWLPASAQSVISATLGRDVLLYRVRAGARGSHVENARHRLGANFTLEGVEVDHGNVRWAMAVRSYGHGNALTPVHRVAPEAVFNRVEYWRGALTEWYVNGPMGLEQGFTVRGAPGKGVTEPLTITLALSGDLSASVVNDQTGLSLRDRDQRPVLSYAGLAAYDSSGRELPAWLELHERELLLRVNDTTAVYPVTVDPIIQLARLTASDGVAGDLMGISVGISGNTVVAGAANATVGSNAGQGAAYIFVEPASGWSDMTETAKLTASDGQAGDGFGGSVGITGNSIIIGACSQSGMCNGQGKVYVFQKPKGGWTTTSKFKAELTASDGSPNDGFSNMMTISRDGKTIAVGAWGATVGGNVNEGAAYIFAKPSSGWKTMHETAKLTERHGAAYDDFGNVAINGDGSTLFVGALQLNFASNNGTGPGKAYIFERPANGWKTTSQFKAKLTASDGLTGDGFGFCQTGAACISSDGTTVVAAAPQFTATSTAAGKAYIFVKPAGGWKTTSQFTAELTASDGNAGDLFGWSPAVTSNQALIGAAGANAAYVFKRPKTGWKTTSHFNAKLSPADGTKGGFGFSTAISGNTIAVGALGNRQTGATFVFGP